VLLAIMAAVGWWIAQRPEPQRAAGRGNQGAPTSVRVALVQNGDIDIATNALGTVTSLSTVTMRTQVTGQLIKIDFQEGQSVKQGELLAEIDPQPFQAVVDQMQGQLDRDQALLSGAKVDLERYRKLSEQKAIPSQQLDTQVALVHQYEGQVAADQGQLKTAKVNLAFTRIVSPSNGRAGLRQVDQGNYVTPGDPNGIVVITQTQPISVIFTVPEDSLPAIVKRVHAGAELPVTLRDRSGINMLATGTLATLDNQIDTTTGTLKLRADFANEDETLYPNQFVNVRLVVDVLKDAAVMPTSGVQRGAPGTYVYLVNADNSVSVRPIELGPVDGERVAVAKGLVSGDRIVIDGADRLRDGAKVIVRQGDSPATTSREQARGE
jgi:membrane fusion protein, multidrug efflux system